MTEKWRPVIGYEDYYEVSNLGRVRSLPREVRTKGGTTRTAPGSILYVGLTGTPALRLVVTLWRDGKRRVYGVARLVLEAFVGPCPPGMEACHFPDRDPRNCKLSNIRWDTRKNNRADMVYHGTRYRGEDHHNARINRRIAKTIRRRRGKGEIVRTIAEDLGLPPSTVWDVVKGRTW